MKNPFDFFDGITVINLDKDISKWVRFVDQTEKYGFADKVVRVPGVFHKNGAYGCAVAHKNCLDTARRRGWSNILIMEDDIKFIYSPTYVKEAVSGAVDKLKKQRSWDLFYLGLSMREPLFSGTEAYTAGDIIKSDKKWFGRFAYAVNNSAFGVFDTLPEETTFTTYDRGDVLLERRKDLKKYVMWPAIASVSGEESYTDPGKIKEVDKFIEDKYAGFKMVDHLSISTSENNISGGNCVILTDLAITRHPDVLSAQSGYSDINILKIAPEILSGFLAGVTAARNRRVNLSGIKDLMGGRFSYDYCKEDWVVILISAEVTPCSGYVDFLRKQVHACSTGTVALVARSGVVSGAAVKGALLVDPDPGYAAACCIPENTVYTGGL